MFTCRRRDRIASFYNPKCILVMLFSLVRLSLSHVLPPPHLPLLSFAAFIPLLSASVISSLLSNTPFPCGRCSPPGLPPLVLALPPVRSWTTRQHQLGDTIVAHNRFVYAYVWMMDLWLVFFGIFLTLEFSNLCIGSLGRHRHMSSPVDLIYGPPNPIWMKKLNQK